MVDRLKASLFALFRASVPRLDYYALYQGKVAKWDASAQVVDVTTNDPRLPSMSGVPFKHGAPGEWIDVLTGTSVLVGWENGDPSLPFAATWSGGESVRKRVLNAGELYLGGEDGAEPALKGDTYRGAEDTYLDAIVTALNAALSAAGLTAAAATLATAQTTFKAAAASYKATNAKVK